MRRSILFALLAVSLFQITNRASQQAVKARIEGVVVRLGTGEPVARARVTLTSTAREAALPAPANSPQRGVPAPPKTVPPAVTDDLGRFTFLDLDEGSFTLQILANGYVSLNYGQRFTNGPGTPITLTAGQDLKNLAITLTPASNISGRVTDRSDQPLVNVPVQLLRYSYDSQGQRSFQPVGATKTNDRGEYRIYWITPGRYYLMAGTPGLGTSPFMAMMTMIAGGDATSANEVPVPLAYAYYPGVLDFSFARVIELRPGIDVDSTNLTLTAKPQTYRIRGRIVDSRTGQPPARARVAASSRSPGMAGNLLLDQISMDLINNYNATSGTFEIRDLLPGSYSVTIIAQDPAPASAAARGGGVPPPGLANSTVAVSISDADVEGLVVTVSPASTLAGRIRSDASQQLPVPPDRMRLQLVARNSQSPIPVPANAANIASPAADGSFRFANVAAGDYRVNLIAQGGARGGAGGAVYLKEVRLDGADVLNSALRISGSMSGTLDIVVGLTNGQISGTVLDRRSQPLPVMQVVLVPYRARDRIELYRTANTDGNGRFLIAGITPGDYKVLSWEGMEPYSWFDPDLMSQWDANGTVIHVTESSTEMIEVKLIPKEGGQ